MLLLVAFLLSAGVFIWAMDRVVLSSNQQIESDGVNRDVARLRTAIERQVADVRGIATAVAARGVDARATTPASEDLGVDFVLRLDAQGKVRSEATRTAGSALSPSALDALRGTVSRSGLSGLEALPNGPAAIASAQLPNGDTLVVGRYLAPQSTSIAQLIQTDVEIAPLASRARMSVPAGQSGVVAFNSNTNLGWTEINGLDGRPALLATVREPRPIMMQASATLSYLQWGISLLSILVGLSIVVMLEGSVLNRLVRLRESVIHFPDDTGSLGPAASGSDEISDLAVALNTTLGRIKASEEAHKHDARHDHLTGLSNRRSLKEDAERILATCVFAEEACCTLVLLDLDGFKRINDDLGHQVGDEVLVWFAQHMRETLRSDSKLCRLGGDEFAVLLPYTNREEAEVAIERLREATTREDDNPCFGMAEVHFSVGFAVAPDHGDTLEMLMQCADTDLYANKRGKAEVA
jgi:diguanylate cyclase (GGDEF)-like protein